MSAPIVADEERQREREVHEVADRVARGLDDYALRGHLIVWLDEDRCEVLSSSNPNVKRLCIFKEDAVTCRCPDYLKNGKRLGLCRHTVQAEVSRAKRVSYLIESKHDSRLMQTVYVLYEVKAGRPRQIGWGNCAEMHWAKWELENPEWKAAA